MATKETNLPKDVGARIKERRILNALTQEDLGELTGLSGESISRLEAGKHSPRPSTLRKLARALDVPVQYFTRPEDDRTL